MAAFAESQGCRMTALIQHFGDTADGLRPCGHCDFCSPESSTSAASYREPTSQEQRHLRSILRALEGSGRSTGKLFTDLALPAPYGSDRKQFDHLLDALARAGLLTLATDTFTSKDDGRTVSYKKATLTHEGRNPGEGDLPITLRDTDATPTPTPRTRKRSSSSSSSKSLSSQPERSAVEGPPPPNHPLTPAQQALDTALRAWRKSEAAKTGKPAFIVLSDRTLTAIAHSAPQTLPDLQRIPGIGPDKLDKYGAALIALCRNTPATAPPQQTSQAPKPGAPSSSAAPSPKTVGPSGHLPRQISPPSSQNQAPADLTPAQQLLDQRLRAWRVAEAERLNLPQFFVLGASTLRSLVLSPPSTLAELRSVNGIGPEKSDKFGLAILEILHP